jgi:hypothetical protein
MVLPAITHKLDLQPQTPHVLASPLRLVPTFFHASRKASSPSLLFTLFMF